MAVVYKEAVAYENFSRAAHHPYFLAFVRGHLPDGERERERERGTPAVYHIYPHGNRETEGSSKTSKTGKYV